MSYPGGEYHITIQHRVDNGGTDHAGLPAVRPTLPRNSFANLARWKETRDNFFALKANGSIPKSELKSAQEEMARALEPIVADPAFVTADPAIAQGLEAYKKLQAEGKLASAEMQTINAGERALLQLYEQQAAQREQWQGLNLEEKVASLTEEERNAFADSLGQAIREYNAGLMTPEHQFGDRAILTTAVNRLISPEVSLFNQGFAEIVQSDPRVEYNAIRINEVNEAELSQTAITQLESAQLAVALEAFVAARAIHHQALREVPIPQEELRNELLSLTVPEINALYGVAVADGRFHLNGRVTDSEEDRLSYQAGHAAVTTQPRLAALADRFAYAELSRGNSLEHNLLQEGGIRELIISAQNAGLLPTNRNIQEIISSERFHISHMLATFLELPTDEERQQVIDVLEAFMKARNERAEIIQQINELRAANQPVPQSLLDERNQRENIEYPKAVSEAVGTKGNEWIKSQPAIAKLMNTVLPEKGDSRRSAELAKRNTAIGEELEKLCTALEIGKEKQSSTPQPATASLGDLPGVPLREEQLSLETDPNWQDEQIIYLSPENNFADIRGRFEGTEAKQIILVIPPQAPLQSHTGWRLLHNAAQELGKNVVVISSDEQIQSVANIAGFTVADSQEESSRGGRPGQNTFPAATPAAATVSLGGLGEAFEDEQLLLDPHVPGDPASYLSTSSPEAQAQIAAVKFTLEFDRLMKLEPMAQFLHELHNIMQTNGHPDFWRPASPEYTVLMEQIFSYIQTNGPSDFPDTRVNTLYENWRRAVEVLNAEERQKQQKSNGEEKTTKEGRGGIWGTGLLAKKAKESASLPESQPQQRTEAEMRASNTHVELQMELEALAMKLGKKTEPAQPEAAPAAPGAPIDNVQSAAATTVLPEAREDQPPSEPVREQIIYLSPDDDLTHIRERLETARARKIILVIPPQAPLPLQSHTGWRLLRNRARELGEDVLIITSDRKLQSAVKAAGFQVAGEDSQEDSPSGGQTRDPQLAPTTMSDTLQAAVALGYATAGVSRVEVRAGEVDGKVQPAEESATRTLLPEVSLDASPFFINLLFEEYNRVRDGGITDPKSILSLASRIEDEYAANLLRRQHITVDPSDLATALREYANTLSGQNAVPVVAEAAPATAAIPAPESANDSEFTYPSSNQQDTSFRTKEGDIAQEEQKEEKAVADIVTAEIAQSQEEGKRNPEIEAALSEYFLISRDLYIVRQLGMVEISGEMIEDYYQKLQSLVEKLPESRYVKVLWRGYEKAAPGSDTRSGYLAEINGLLLRDAVINEVRQGRFPSKPEDIIQDTPEETALAWEFSLFARTYRAYWQFLLARESYADKVSEIRNQRLTPLLRQTLETTPLLTYNSQISELREIARKAIRLYNDTREIKAWQGADSAYLISSRQIIQTIADRLRVSIPGEPLAILREYITAEKQGREIEPELLERLTRNYILSDLVLGDEFTYKGRNFRDLAEEWLAIKDSGNRDDVRKAVGLEVGINNILEQYYADIHSFKE